MHFIHGTTFKVCTLKKLSYANGRLAMTHDQSIHVVECDKKERTSLQVCNLG